MFFLVGELGYVLFTHVTFAYPYGRVSDRLERAYLWAAYVVAVAFPLAILLFYGGTERLRFLDPFPRENLLLVSDSPRAVDVLQDAFAVMAYGVLGTLFVVLVLRKFFRASPRARRVYLPLLIAAVGAALWAVLNGVLTFATSAPAIVYDLFWWQIVALTALPLAMLWGLLRARLARVHVGELVVHLEETPVDGLRDEIALALEDPTLELGLWIPDRGIYVDSDGVELAVSEDGPERAVTWVEHEGRPLASSSTTRRCARSRSSWRRWPPRRGSRSSTRGCMRRCAHSSRPCRSRVRGSSRRRTRSVAGSSATCTTARSSVSWRSRWSCAAPSAS